MDLTKVFPLVGLEIGAFTMGQAVPKVTSSKVAKHEKTHSDNRHAFIPFTFDIFRFLSPETLCLIGSWTLSSKRLILSSKKGLRRSLLHACLLCVIFFYKHIVNNKILNSRNFQTLKIKFGVSLIIIYSCKDGLKLLEFGRRSMQPFCTIQC